MGIYKVGGLRLGGVGFRVLNLRALRVDTSTVHGLNGYNQRQHIASFWNVSGHFQKLGSP